MRDEPVVSWGMALRPGQDEAELGDGEYFGYPADAGQGSFGSPEVYEAAVRGGGVQQLHTVAHVGGGEGDVPAVAKMADGKVTRRAAAPGRAENSPIKSSRIIVAAL